MHASRGTSIWLPSICLFFLLLPFQLGNPLASCQGRVRGMHIHMHASYMVSRRHRIGLGPGITSQLPCFYEVRARVTDRDVQMDALKG